MSADMPIRRRLMMMVLLTSGAALLLACLGFFAYEFFNYRQSALRNLNTLGAVIADNSSAALAFYNVEDGREVLSALKAEPNVVAAALYDRTGDFFAGYPRDAALGLSQLQDPRPGFRFENTQLAGFVPVREGDSEALGWLYLQYDLRAFYTSFRDYALMAAVLLLASFLVAWLVGRRLQKQISEPILELASVARSVTDRKDYSQRVTRRGRDELGTLTHAFNDMLEHIQAQLARLELLNRITRGIGERQDNASVFQVVVRSLEEDLPTDFAVLCLYEPINETLLVSRIGVRSLPLASELGLAEDGCIPVGENGLARCVRGQLVYEPDVREVPFAFPQQLAAVGLRAVVFAPLMTESRINGVLIVARREPQSFSSGDCEFLRQLSEHTALAAHQAQLYQALQQAYEDRRQTQHSIMQQERLRALGQMASGIAHDINNAISPIVLYTESLLEREPNLSERTRDYLTTIQRAIDDVAETVTRMREFYRPRELQLQLASVDVNRLLKQVLELTRARWSDLSQQQGVMIELDCRLAEDLPTIRGAEGEIRDALTNLIFNAADAMPAGGTLSVTTGLLNGEAALRQVWLEVRDSGVGMSEDTRRRCLEPFFTTKGERGTGLGLPMVYGMVQRHSAELQIDSELGKGTAMRLIFPVIPPDFSATQRLAAPHIAGERLRLLVIDDDPLLTKSLRETLEGDGHAVTTADGGQAGIEAFMAAQKRSEPFAVVITDLGMPYVDGRKVAASIGAASPDTPLIMLTGWGQRLIAENDMPEHVDRLLNKPPRLHELRKALAELTNELTNK